MTKFINFTTFVDWLEKAPVYKATEKELALEEGKKIIPKVPRVKAANCIKY